MPDPHGFMNASMCFVKVKCGSNIPPCFFFFFILLRAEAAVGLGPVQQLLPSFHGRGLGENHLTVPLLPAA